MLVKLMFTDQDHVFLTNWRFIMGFITNLYENMESYLAILGAFSGLLTAVSVITPSKRLDKCVTTLDKVGFYADKFGIAFKKQI